MLVRLRNTRNPHLLLVEIQNGIAMLKDNLEALCKTNHILSKLFSIFLGIYPNELKLNPPKNLYTNVYNCFIHNRANFECLSVDEWIDKLVSPRNGILFSTKKKLSIHEKTWRKFKYISLSERSQSEKDKYCVIPTIRHSEKGKTMGTVKRSVVSRNLGEEMWVNNMEHRIFFGGSETSV